MATELARFKIDAQIREQAAKVCSQHGYELSDVLRAVVTRIARDGRIPVDLDTRRSADTLAPFSDYDPRLWATVKPQLDAEFALVLLSRFIADRSASLDAACSSAQADPAVIARLSAERDAARSALRNLDVANPGAVAKVLSSFSGQPDSSST